MFAVCERGKIQGHLFQLIILFISFQKAIFQGILSLKHREVVIRQQWDCSELQNYIPDLMLIFDTLT